MDQSIVALDEKIDALTAQVAYLTEQAQIGERQRQERAELVADLMPVVNDAYRLAIEQLEEVQEYIDLGDLLRLVKRLARNGHNLEMMLDQLESLADLFHTLAPLADEGFGKAVDMLTSMEEKGYFAFARSGARLMDNVVTSFSQEDVDRLGDNVVLILNTVKQMTQPEIMNFVHSTLLVAEAGDRQTGRYFVYRLAAPAARPGSAPRSRPHHARPARHRRAGCRRRNGKLASEG